MIYLILLVGAVVTGHVAWVIAALLTFLLIRWAGTPPSPRPLYQTKRRRRRRR